MAMDLTPAYCEVAFRRPDIVVELGRKFIPTKCDTLVGTGLSGAVILPTLARILEKHFAIVRKPNDGTHSYHEIEGMFGDHWVFVDDTIATGDTFIRVYEAVNRLSSEYFFPTRYLGMLLYTRGYSSAWRPAVGGSPREEVSAALYGSIQSSLKPEISPAEEHETGEERAIGEFSFGTQIYYK